MQSLSAPLLQRSCPSVNREGKLQDKGTGVHWSLQELEPPQLVPLHSREQYP